MNKPTFQFSFRHLFLTGWRPFAWIVILGSMIYSQALFFEFTYLDDNTLIINNIQFLSDFSNILEIFRQDVFHIPHESASYYRPILTLSFMFEACMGGLNPFIYHLTNILIHLCVSCLVFVLLLKLDFEREKSFIFSLLFAVHPVLSQAVCWIPGRNDSLLALFILLAFIFFLNYLESSKKQDYLGLQVFFLYSLLTKESAIMFPIVCVSYLLLVKKEKALLKYANVFWGWGIVLAVWFILRTVAIESFAPYSAKVMASSLWVNMPAIFLYFGKVFLPVNLSVLPILQDSSLLYGFVSSVLIIGLLFVSKQRKGRYIAFGAVWFFAFLILGFLRPNVLMHADFIEHRIYLPIIGVIILLSVLSPLKGWRYQRVAGLLIGAVFFVSFLFMNIKHINNFKDRISFWTNAAKTSPHAPLAHSNLGAMYFLDGMFEAAHYEFLETIRLDENHAKAHSNLGLIYMRQGRFSDADREFSKEIIINPLYDDAYYNFALLRYRQRRLSEARDLLRKTISINPDHIDAYIALATDYYQQGDFEQAAVYVEKLKESRADAVPQFLKRLTL